MTVVGSLKPDAIRKP